MGCIKLFYFAEKNSTLKMVYGGRFVGGKSGLGAYRYGFNGKEKDTDGEWGNQTHYDYGFRIYNPSIGKFLSVDPLTSSYPWYTPYQFAGNKPVVAMDLDGLEEYTIHSASISKQFKEAELDLTDKNEVLAWAYKNANVIAKHPTENMSKYGSPASGVLFTVDDVYADANVVIYGYTKAEEGQKGQKIELYNYYREAHKGNYALPEFIPPKKDMGPVRVNMSKMDGLPGAIATGIMKYTPFGLGYRALYNYQEGYDPYTGEMEETSRLVKLTGTGFLTMGTGPVGAGLNVAASGVQEVLSRQNPDKKTGSIGVRREVFDIGVDITLGLIKKDPSALIGFGANLIELEDASTHNTDASQESSTGN